MNKEEVYIACLDQLNAGLAQLSEELQNLNQALAAETKSSAGDKYETSREMLNLERNRIGQQYESLTFMRNELQRIPTPRTDKSEKGALFKTQRGTYYVSIPLGEVNVGTTTIHAISPTSPLSCASFEKKENDRFLINGQEHRIDWIK